MASELTKRVAVAAVGIPLAVVVLYIGGWVLALVLAGIAAGGAAEFYRLSRQRGVEPLVPIGVVAAAVPVLLPVLTANAPTWAMHFFIATSLVAAAAAIFTRGVSGSPLNATAATVFGALLTGGTLMYAMLLRLMPVASDTTYGAWVGPALLAFPITLTWMSDSWAYFGGRRFGRRKLIPAVSPGKTVEGAMSSVIGGIVIGALYAHFVFGAWLGVPVSALTGAVIGLVISPVAQIGDLAESLLKREAGVKDSGTLLPGHGGVLDRFDALFFTIPITYWLLQLVLRVS